MYSIKVLLSHDHLATYITMGAQEMIQQIGVEGLGNATHDVPTDNLSRLNGADNTRSTYICAALHHILPFVVSTAGLGPADDPMVKGVAFKIQKKLESENISLAKYASGRSQQNLMKELDIRA